MTVCTHIVLGLGDPAPPFRLSQTCGICGSRAIRYRDKYSHEALCQPCVNKYVQAWYLAERMEHVFEAPALNR
jgi:hypothetical protein